MSGWIPARLDEATKIALVDLVEGAEAAGWSTGASRRYLELSLRRLERWRNRQRSGVGLADRASGLISRHPLRATWHTDRSSPDRVVLRAPQS